MARLLIQHDDIHPVGRAVFIFCAQGPDIDLGRAQAGFDQEGSHRERARQRQPPRRAGRGRKTRVSPVPRFAQSHALEVRTPESLRDCATRNEFAALDLDAAVVAAYGLILPKPVLDDNGSGMHVHQSIWKDGTPTFAGSGYADLSEAALNYIGGIMKHAKALNAFTNPTTNSYKRLSPGFEAPVLLAYSARNRSAGCRIPYSASPGGKRVEVRFPDPAANAYLAFAAMLMAGLDGIQNKIDPGDPMDKDLYDLPPDRRVHLQEVAQLLVDDRLDDALDVAVAELRLRLPLELGIGHLDGDDADEAFANVLAGQGGLEFLEEPDLAAQDGPMHEPAPAAHGRDRLWATIAYDNSPVADNEDVLDRY